MTLEEFYDTTPIEFDWCLKYFYRDKRDNWERTRIQTFILYSILNASDEKIDTPEELMPFPWDEENTKIEIPVNINWEVLEKKYRG